MVEKGFLDRVEPIPLGHRQMVKKYFELIRPSNSDPADKKAAQPEK